MASISFHFPSANREPRRNGNQLRVRPYCDSDYNEVRDLFVVAMGTGQHLQRPTTYLTYAIFGVGLAISLKPSRRSLGMALAIGASAAFFGVRWIISKAFRDYCNMCLKSDLADIGNYYMSTHSTSTCKTSPQNLNHPDAEHEDTTFGSMGSGFWVVEDVSNLENTGMKKIVGSIGLDMSTTTDQTVGELRRMAVSPYYRRRGIGTFLLNTLITHARKHALSSVFLSTSSYQEAAIRMYEKYGWTIINKKDASDWTMKVYWIEMNLGLSWGNG
ncbi:acyl-CoA N-acyltransferase [Crucibulum laeve]|uniref:Probable N-acetyltransferase 14 n=1 Tax=Crucibulum laeve TaxID=68775 RepID=A0A5C3LQT2_9AGAR|nr:acyl-CoA N-acyltransferase [Crucibulum laeve]